MWLAGKILNRSGLCAELAWLGGSFVDVYVSLVRAQGRVWVPVLGEGDHLLQFPLLPSLGISASQLAAIAGVGAERGVRVFHRPKRFRQGNAVGAATMLALLLVDTDGDRRRLLL